MRNSRSPDGSSATLHPPAWRALACALLLVAVAVDPVAAGQSTVTAPSVSTAAEVEPMTVRLKQSAVGYDTVTNRAQVTLKVVPSGAVAPWTWSVSVRGSLVASGTTSDPTVTLTVGNDCRVTSMSVTTQVTDALGQVAADAERLDTSLCPPPPWHDYARDRILASPTLSEASFVDRLRAAGSPALKPGGKIYRKLVRAGVNPAYALGMFQAESSSGTRGYAVITKNWGNILFYSWTREYGAVPYAPGNGYTYAMFPTWRASVRALCALFKRYWDGHYRSVYSSSAHWLGARPGSDRHLRYLDNIVATMAILPDDVAPTMTDLALPGRSRGRVEVAWAATDNRGVLDYQVKRRRNDHEWKPRRALAEASLVLTLKPGTWRIAVRARDAAGNWSAWAKDTIRVR